jgi:hypothetical protein
MPWYVSGNGRASHCSWGPTLSANPLCDHRHNNQIFVVIEPGASPLHARMRLPLLGWIKAPLRKAMNLTASREASAEGDDRTQVIARGSEEVVG